MKEKKKTMRKAKVFESEPVLVGYEQWVSAT